MAGVLISIWTGVIHQKVDILIHALPEFEFIELPIAQPTESCNLSAVSSGTSCGCSGCRRIPYVTESHREVPRRGRNHEPSSSDNRVRSFAAYSHIRIFFHPGSRVDCTPECDFRAIVWDAPTPRLFFNHEQLVSLEAVFRIPKRACLQPGICRRSGAATE